jgi:hypothetical protein
MVCFNPTVWAMLENSSKIVPPAHARRNRLGPFQEYRIFKITALELDVGTDKAVFNGNGCLMAQLSTPADQCPFAKSLHPAWMTTPSEAIRSMLTRIRFQRFQGPEYERLFQSGHRFSCLFVLHCLLCLIVQIDALTFFNSTWLALAYNYLIRDPPSSWKVQRLPIVWKTFSKTAHVDDNTRSHFDALFR